MEASGPCHTGIHAANGDWPVKSTPAFVPGHEGVGLVHAIGEAITGIARPGERSPDAGLRASDGGITMPDGRPIPRELRLDRVGVLWRHSNSTGAKNTVRSG